VRKFANFALFQLAWYASVEAASRGHVWIGPLAVALLLLAHLAWLGMRARDVGIALLIGLAGGALDSGLMNAGVLAYPGSHGAWPSALAPPWIAGRWAAFATLPRLSMAWLAHRPIAAVVLGAVGGPLSYRAGVAMDAVAVPASELLTYGVLALQYAIATPLLLRLLTRERT
jgi:hypothetical protein